MKDKTVTEKEVLAEIKEAEKMFNNRFLYPYYNNRSEAFIFAYILYHFGVESIAPSATWTCGDKAINAIQIHDTSVVMHPNVSVKGTPLPWFLARLMGYSMNGGAGDGGMQINLMKKEGQNWRDGRDWSAKFNSELILAFLAMKESKVTEITKNA